MLRPIFCSLFLLQPWTSTLLASDLLPLKSASGHYKCVFEHRVGVVPIPGGKKAGEINDPPNSFDLKIISTKASYEVPAGNPDKEVLEKLKKELDAIPCDIIKSDPNPFSPLVRGLCASFRAELGFDFGTLRLAGGSAFAFESVSIETVLGGGRQLLQLSPDGSFFYFEGSVTQGFLGLGQCTEAD